MPGRRKGTEKLIAVAVGLALVGMATLNAMLGLHSLARVSGPAVGDIVAFDVDTPIPDTLPTQLQVVRADGSPCQLDLTVMRQVHGSLVVDRTTNTAPLSFRLHWAGRHSSLGATDCGPTADITATDRVMAALLVATGGVGTGPSKRALPVYILRHTPKALD